MAESTTIANVKTLPLGSGHIGTSITGIKKLWDFHERAKKYKNRTIVISLDNIKGIDGNLCALFGIILYSLQRENNLVFTINAIDVAEKCDVLFANEFLKLNTERPKDNDCVRFRAFYPNEKESFLNYLADELLVHKGMPELTELGREKIIDDLTELYGNIHKHAETKLPFFVCGQYFPKDEILKFTIADLGEGFFPKIKKVQPEQISTHTDAIQWAMNGNSTKPDAPGGKGLINIRNYLETNNGHIQVFSGYGGWQSLAGVKAQIETVEMPYFCVGATINLIFSKNKLISDLSLRYG